MQQYYDSSYLGRSRLYSELHMGRHALAFALQFAATIAALLFFTFGYAILGVAVQ